MTRLPPQPPTQLDLASRPSRSLSAPAGGKRTVAGDYVMFRGGVRLPEIEMLWHLDDEPRTLGRPIGAAGGTGAHAARP
jgi:hypothetical protein